ncbi:hypothetical protein Tco_0600122 [Tanacetum coccineum]|uniref:Uncharacterized protein n=1 Tax=Tanacetum coccineum TaxID=301880 RepID=A0ABQ4WAT6_9ASTR
METKNTSSSGSVLEEPEIQKLQMQAKIFKENSLNKLNALKSTTQLLERQSILYQQAFAQLLWHIKTVTWHKNQEVSPERIQFYKSALNKGDQNASECVLMSVLTLAKLMLSFDLDNGGKAKRVNISHQDYPNTANGLQIKTKNSSINEKSVSNKDVHLGEHRKQKPFLKFNDLQCPTCKKCLYSANHDECVLEYLSRLNPRASAQNKDAKSHKTTKRYMPVEKSSASKKPERQIPTGHRFSNKKTTTVPEKTMNPRSCLRWKPTGRIFKTIGLRWVPTGKIFAFSTNKVDSEPPNGSKEDITNQCESEQALDVSAGTLLSTADQASVFMAMMSVHISSGLVLHQMTSDHNRSELGIQDHSNEPSSSKLVPKVVPLACQDSYSRQEVELLFHHHIAMLRTTCRYKIQNQKISKDSFYRHSL